MSPRQHIGDTNCSWDPLQREDGARCKIAGGSCLLCLSPPFFLLFVCLFVCCWCASPFVSSTRPRACDASTKGGVSRGCTSRCFPSFARTRTFLLLLLLYISFLFLVCFLQPSRKMRAALARGAPRPPPYQLLVLFLFTFTHCINILNWVFYINFLHTWANPAIIAAYLAFSIIGGIVFFLLASPIMYWTYFYADQISPKTRRNAFCAGITACFLLHGFPMEWIEVYLVWYYGWRSILSGISLLLVSFNFAIGFFVTWMGYTWLISRRLQLSSGATTAGNVPPSGGAPSRYVISSTS